MTAMAPVFAAAHAKINLTLAVLGRRGDGYHRLASVIQTISLADTLRFDVGAVADSFTCDIAALATPDNLVARAAALLRAEAQRPDLMASIELRKEVPTQGGLGGGSGDAAATLVALNALWRLGLPLERLEALATRLGSDTPCLVYGGTTRIAGRGEIVQPLPDAEPLWLALAKPPVDISSPRFRRASRCHSSV